MPVMTVAALVVQLMSAGGAGEQAAGRQQGDPGSISTNLSALKGEVSSLSERFKAARERRRQQTAKEKEAWERESNAPARPGRQ